MLVWMKMVVILARVKDNCSAWLEQFYIMLKYSSIFFNYKINSTFCIIFNY